MRFFPQLASGASGQFPIRKRRISRTIVNETADGRRIKLADDGGVAIEWQLTFDGLSDAEAVALNQFFAESEGRLGSFTFVDPTDNLFVWSEKLDDSAWLRNALLQVSGGISDPLGTQRASRLTNASGAALRLEQVVNAPESQAYALSVYARSAGVGRIGLYRTGTATHLKTFDVGSGWQRIVLSGGLGGPAESVRFGLEVEAGATIEVFGLQAEAQPGASGYKKTTSRAGVYPNARFAEDELEIIAEGVNWNACRVTIVALA